MKNAKQNSDDEAVEESDEGDFDDREVDYMSDTSRYMLGFDPMACTVRFCARHGV